MKKIFLWNRNSVWYQTWQICPLSRNLSKKIVEYTSMGSWRALFEQPSRNHLRLHFGANQGAGGLPGSYIVLIPNVQGDQKMYNVDIVHPACKRGDTYKINSQGPLQSIEGLRQPYACMGIFLVYLKSFIWGFVVQITKKLVYIGNFLQCSPILYCSPFLKCCICYNINS